ncbi:ABC-type antimicrobial peptide transport system, ATPase component protein [Herbaspirillum rubrisubalbicans M1]|uniref:MacB family efflux pump subunit n=1 Tax=Herbaspirillum rubrisubalbicans TaxID=80842 RepID=UPI000739F7A9|nr:MacB family efflux pump subunit [Herbaspirillum rubrisubalbicans]ALU89456.1 ABC-type antimicrobial peptide transport system, ATPase component protein [Herbaspirillum rubrisubalbicans M1]
MVSAAIPLIELRDLRKAYPAGEEGAPVEVIKGISLTIHAGEFVALVGSSGSGKSTLMHILGCLDRPNAGSYRIRGQDVGQMEAEELARLRRETFGFVFQGYHLIRTLDALDNVQMPALYAGLPPQQRQKRATELLARLGLGRRLHHRPGQLSGGQQQRVSIARALINGGQIILADEPTGALDSKSGAEVVQLLHELAAAGHTVILITHDHAIAAQADRRIEIRDGTVVADSGPVRPPERSPCGSAGQSSDLSLRAPWALRETLLDAWRALGVNRFRTLLTLLSIIIGVASVIVMMAIGLGTQAQVIEKMALFGSNRMYVVPGAEQGRTLGGVLMPEDVALVASIPNVAIAMPFREGNVTLRAGRVDVQSRIWAVTSDAPRVLNWKTVRGEFFSRADETSLAAVAVLGKKVRQRLFGQQQAMGRYLLVNDVPFRVIGELAEKGLVTGDSDDDDVILVPFSSATRRVLGQTELSWISILLDDVSQSEATAQEITRVMQQVRRVKDFQVFNQAALIAAQKETQQTLTLMLGLIAAISLVVGGIGVMNIMLMSVAERTREIGIRLAVGARQGDIRRQFLCEAMVVSLVGGGAGAIIGIAIGVLLILAGVHLIFSLGTILTAFASALLTGLAFGFMPASKAARLDPVQALSSE